MSFNINCPYCGRATTVTDPNTDSGYIPISIANPSNWGEIKNIHLGYEAIVCPNKNCKKMILSVSLNQEVYLNQMYSYKSLTDWFLLPESQAKVLPDYIPSAIKEDYYEACRIKTLSSKASATLSRRCLQGMIRNFFKITSERTLKKEIDELEDHIDPDIWEAIDAIRKIGNIGAHMEKNINLIIDVDPEEAQALISLIELLIDEWYVARHKRKEKTQRVKEIAEQKKNDKEQKTNENNKG